jgi:hypothetical protein
MSGDDTPAYSPIAQTRGETEAQRATARFDQVVDVSVGANSFAQQSETNTDTDDRVIEFVSMRLRDNFTNLFTVELTVNVGELQQAVFTGNTLHFPFSFDPGLTWLEGEDVGVTYFNDSGSTVDFELNIAYIPLE